MMAGGTVASPSTARAAGVGVLAIDGGQSAVRALHSSQGETVEVEGVSRGGDSAAAIVAAVKAAWMRLGRPAVGRAVLGLTTAPRDARAAGDLAAGVARAIGCHEVWVADDAVTTHAGALSLQTGISVAAGTGVACLALPVDAEPVILGGHGYLLGDEGGGFWIGREGLRAALRAGEGRGEPTVLTSLAATRFGAEHLDIRLHDAARPVDMVAQFARDVLDASTDDTVARGIVAAAAVELRDLVVTAAALVGAPPVAVGLGGRLLGAGPLRAALDDLLGAEPSLAPRSADHAPVEGGLLLGESGTPGRYRSLVHVWRAEGDA